MRQRLWLQWLAAGLSACIPAIACFPSQAAPPCLDIRQQTVFTFEGVLTHRVFPGPPNYEDTRRGDEPEPTYILQLDQPVCAKGDEFLDENSKIDTIHVFPDVQDRLIKKFWKNMRKMIGHRVTVEGNTAFGAHTGHHHAPLVLAITRITARK